MEELIGGIIIALLLAAVFYYGFKITGPWGTFWTFLLVLIIGIWMVAALAEPVGPLWWGVAWLDLFVIGLLFALLLVAATPTERDRRRYKEYYGTTDEETASSAVAVGIWFWVMILVFFIVIVLAALA